MTIEAKRSESRYFGLKKTDRTRLLDFRGYSEKKSPILTLISRPDDLWLEG